jgi:hypothetical protein
MPPHAWSSIYGSYGSDADPELLNVSLSIRRKGVGVKKELELDAGEAMGLAAN